LKKSRDYLSWALALLALGFTGLYALEAHFDANLNEAEALAGVSAPGCVAHATGTRGEELLVTCQQSADITGIPGFFEVVVIRYADTQQRCQVAESKPTACVAQDRPSIRAVAPPHSS
jgi:hypothetical protein